MKRKKRNWRKRPIVSISLFDFFLEEDNEKASLTVKKEKNTQENEEKKSKEEKKPDGKDIELPKLNSDGEEE